MPICHVSSLHTYVFREGPFNIKARAHFMAMSFNKSATFVLSARPEVRDYNEHVVEGSNPGQER